MNANYSEGTIMPAKIDFNCDMGESFGPYKMGLDEEVIKYISSANVACGFHASDPTWMRLTVRLAEENGVAVGAHPSLPDLMGFGRRVMDITPEDAKDYVTYQIGALQAFTTDKKLQHVKPHGALYNMVAKDETLARALCEAVLEIDPSLILVVLSGTSWARIAVDMGVRVAREIFSERALNPDGSLVPRSLPGSVIHDPDEVVERSVKMVIEGKATAITGEEILVEADTICLHSDTPGAIEMAQKLRTRLNAEKVAIVPMCELV